MESKQLNFSAPILSVRRISSKLSSSDRQKGERIEKPRPSGRISRPSYTPESHLDLVTEPVAVPFHWEQIPGKVKDGRESQSELHGEEVSITPRVPPGRVLDVAQTHSEIEPNNQNMLRPPNEASSFDDHLTKLEGVHEEGDTDLDSGSEAYSDAVGTLSPSSSLSLSCSVSGLSGSDGADVKPSGTFSMDPQTRDFMMSRFLPAAKAMVLEIPHYASRKQPVVLEHPREVKKLINVDRKPSLNQHSPTMHYGPYEEEEESEAEHDEYDASGNLPGCGLISRFCLKNSLCPLNPLPGMKVRTRVPTYSAPTIKKLGKNAYVRDHDQIVNKNAWDVLLTKQLDYGVQSSKLHEVGSMMMGESNRTYSSDSQATDGSSPYRHSSSGGGISPYRNEAPYSPFHEGMGFLGVPKEVGDFKADRLSLYNQGDKKFSEILSHQESKQWSDSLSPTVEKTLYIDSINAAEIQHLNSPDTKELMDSAAFDFGTLVERRGIEEASSAESSFQDIRCLSTSNKGVLLKSKAPGSVDSLPSSSDIPHISSQEDTPEGFRLDQVLDQEFRTLDFSKGPIDENSSVSNEHILKADDQVDPNVTSLQSPIPPPLPKSPSESWLWRTVSLQNSYSSSKFHPRKQASKTSSTSSKWETIVKTTKLHYDHGRYSEELITHVPQQPKT